MAVGDGEENCIFGRERRNQQHRLDPNPTSTYLSKKKKLKIVSAAAELKLSSAEKSKIGMKKKCRKVLLTQLYFPTVSTSQKSSFCASSFEWKNAGEKNSNCFHLCSYGNLIGRKSDSLAIRRKLRSFFLLVSCS